MDMNEIGGIAVGLVDEFKRVLPRQRKTQRENLALSLTLYAAVSTGVWHSTKNPSPAEKRQEKQTYPKAATHSPAPSFDLMRDLTSAKSNA